jgi:hypothetical protein
MRLIIVLISIFILTITTSLLMVASSPIIEKGKISESKLMEIIQRILKDPEFMALKPQKQLRLLIVIYNILERHMKKL